MNTCSFLYISLNICFGAQKNGLIETVLLSTNNIYVLVEKLEMFYFEANNFTDFI